MKAHGSMIVRSVSMLLLAMFLSFATACRFQAPDVRESTELYKRSTFGGAVPAWMPRAAISPEQARRSAGFIPGTLGAPKNVSSNEASSIARAARTEQKKAREERILEEDEETPAMQDTSVVPGEAGEKDTTLKKLDRECPGLAPLIEDALITTDAEKRKRKRLDMIRQCPNAAQLWLWLGQDYMALDDLPRAYKALKKAAFLEPDNMEARELIREVKDRRRRQLGLDKKPRKKR